MAVNLRLAALVLAFLVVPANAVPACRLSDLGWMVGRWSVHNGAYSGQVGWGFSASGQLIEFTTGSGAPSSGGVVKLSAISSQENMLVLRMWFFDGSLKHTLGGQDAPVFYPVSACGPGFIQFHGIGGEYTRYERLGADVVNTGIANNNGKPGHYRVLLVREK